MSKSFGPALRHLVGLGRTGVLVGDAIGVLVGVRSTDAMVGKVNGSLKSLYSIRYQRVCANRSPSAG